MSWYYAGPDAKPVGPVTLEQLRALREAGSLTADTFVIEHGGDPATLVWKRYSDAFPPIPALPAAPTFVPAPAPAPVAAAPTPTPHPLFPSAVPAGYPAHQPTGYPLTHPIPPSKTSNGWCVWGFVVSLISCLLALVCGIGLIPALISAVLCVVGLAQVMRHREQGGMALAISGLIFSFLAIIVAVLFIIFVDMKMTTHNGITVTEQTSNDAD